MRIRTALIVPVLAGLVISAQAEPWKVAVQSNLQLTVNTYSDNWTGGDVGSFTWAAQALVTAERQFNEKINNKNTLKLAFGQTKTQDKSTKRWSAPQKSTDLIDFESVLRFTLGGWVDPYIGLHVVSQFMDEYYVASGTDSIKLDKEGNPIDLTESFGVARTYMKTDNVDFGSRFGGAFKQNIDRKRVSDSLVTNDGGLEFVTELKANHPSKIISYSSRLSLYEALFRINPDPNDYWRHPDLNWDNTIAVSLAKYIMLSLNLQMIYDREKADGGLQWRETAALGLTYAVEWPKK